MVRSPWPNLAEALNIEVNKNNREVSSITMNFVSDVSGTPLARTHHAFTSIVKGILNYSMKIAEEVHDI